MIVWLWIVRSAVPQQAAQTRPTATKIEAKRTSAQRENCALLSLKPMQARWAATAPLSRRMASGRLGASCSDCQQGLAAICCWPLQEIHTARPHKKSQANLPHNHPAQRIPSRRGGRPLPIGLNSMRSSYCVQKR
jgi:hypothetical protein